jgi:hypothetical protein
MQRAIDPTDLCTVGDGRIRPPKCERRHLSRRPFPATGLTVGSATRHARPRLAAAAIAVVVLLCQATAWVHAAATPHVTCAEHGESVHLGPSFHSKAGGAAPRSDRDHRAVTGAVAESVAHGHEHCGLAAHRSTSVSAPPAGSVHTQTEPASPILPSSPERAPVRTLSLAPKTSPPHAPTV